MVKVKKGGKKKNKNKEDGNNARAGPSSEASSLVGSILQENNTSTTRRSLFCNEGEDFIVDIVSKLQLFQIRNDNFIPLFSTLFSTLMVWKKA
jgi:hypothetical protein